MTLHVLFKVAEADYALPASLIQGKQRVTVRFQAAPGREVAPVFGIRSLRRPPR